MQSKTLSKGIVCALLVLGLAVCSTAQLSGDYTIDPNGSGPTNYTTFAAASAALSAGVSGWVKFTVASTTFQESVAFNPVTGASSTNTVTFVASGTPAVIDANSAQDGLTLNTTCSYFVFDNFIIKGFTRYGVYLPGPSSTRATFCTFRNLMVDAPATTSTGVCALYLYYPNDCTFEDCVFAGGGRVLYTQQINRCFFRRCEFDGKGSASQIVSLWNSNDSDNLYENCFLHDCSSSGYGFYVNYSQYGNMFWHNTIIVNTSQVGIFLGSCCAWSRANSFRNNIVVNTGSGGCIRYGHSGGFLDYNDADHNCYYAPSGNVCELEGGTTFTKGTLAQWLAFFNANRTTLVRTGGPTPAQARFDDNSIEADPSLVSMTSPYDIHLQGTSPCVDAGTTTYVAGSWISYNASYVVVNDFEGDPRPATNVDIGADEGAVRIVLSGSPSPAGTVVLDLSAPADGGLTFQVGSSFGKGPIPIGSRQLELDFDPLLVIAVTGAAPGLFANYAGVLNSQGKAQAKIVLPNIAALKNLRIYNAFVTLKPSAPQGVESISPTVIFTIL